MVFKTNKKEFVELQFRTKTRIDWVRRESNGVRNLAFGVLRRFRDILRSSTKSSRNPWRTSTNPEVFAVKSKFSSGVRKLGLEVQTPIRTSSNSFGLHRTFDELEIGSSEFVWTPSEFAERRRTPKVRRTSDGVRRTFVNQFRVRQTLFELWRTSVGVRRTSSSLYHLPWTGKRHTCWSRPRRGARHRLVSGNRIMEDKMEKIIAWYRYHFHCMRSLMVAFILERSSEFCTLFPTVYRNTDLIKWCREFYESRSRWIEIRCFTVC